MTLITSLLDWLAMLTEPFWLTLYALSEMIGEAGAGTALFAGFLLLVSLDFLRSSKDALIPVARAFAIASSIFFVASFVYGDFLAAPAKALFSSVVARSDVVPPNVVALTTLGAAGAGAFFFVGRRQMTVRAVPARPQAARVSAAGRRDQTVAALGHALAIDAAGRLQLRQMSRNAKKTVNTVRPAVRAMAPVAVAARGGARRATRFERI